MASDHVRCRASLSLTPAGDCVRLCRDHGGESPNRPLGFWRMSGSAWEPAGIPTGGKPQRRGGVALRPRHGGVPQAPHISQTSRSSGGSALRGCV